jgi:hypothetical protein
MEKITSEYELLAFAEQIQFPSHGIPLKKVYTKNHKGIVTHELLLQHYKELKAEFVCLCRNRYESTIQSYTDESNRKATQNLIEKIKHLCPNCSTPDLICYSTSWLLLRKNCPSIYFKLFVPM